MDDNTLLLEADRCVKCGLCLPHCPTYRLTQNEGDSPRGRISLIQGLAQGNLPADKHLTGHLDSCLHCLNCQGACPSRVNYGAIIDQGLARLPNSTNTFSRLLVRISLSSRAGKAITLLRTSILYRLSLIIAPLSFARILKLLPPANRGRKGLELSQPTSAENQLFLGCISRITDKGAIEAFQTVATKLQIPVSVPAGQSCCGAMDAHGGDQKSSQPHRQRNIDSFKTAKNIITLASGCGAFLKTYQESRVVDAGQFLLETAWPETAELLPFEGTIALHTPCSLRNGMKSDSAVTQLIEKIPNADIAHLSPGYGCCGGGGLQLIKQPETGERLLQPIMDEILSLQPKVILSSNTGCSLHIQRGLQDRNLDIRVMHPVELIAELLP